MCRNSDHGGRRCPVDTTPQRRYRRKATSIISQYSHLPSPPHLELNNQNLTPFNEIGSFISETKTALYAPPPNNMTGEQWDMENELRINHIGAILAQEAEIQANVDVEEIIKEIDTLNNQIYSLQKRLDIISHKLTVNENNLPPVIPDLLSIQGKIRFASLPEEQKTAINVANSLKKDQQTVEVEIKVCKEAQDKLIFDTNKKLSQAYWEVLGSVRTMGGEIKADTANDTAETIRETLGNHYPAEWIEISNQNNILNISHSSTGRPEYRSENVPLSLAGVNGEVKEIIETFPHYDTQTFSTDLGMEGTAVFYPDVIVSPDGDTRGVHPLTKQEGSFSPFKGDSIVYRSPLTADEQEIVGQNILQNLPAGTLYHEFGHRMEQVLPNRILVRQEEAFLKRRTAKINENWFTNMVPVNEKEFVHSGGFVAPYVGKEYFDGKRYEVFTTGVQALYTGEYGGLVGVSTQYTEPDMDHRNFILGILATV